MSLHINKDRDNINEEFIEHDAPEDLVPEWFDHINNGNYVVQQQARSWGKTETASNLVWQSFI